MKVKTYDQFLKEELGWKDALIGAAIGLSPFTPQQAKSQTPYTQQQNQKVLSTVTFERKEPISNPDLDLVHGALGSKRLDDDFKSENPTMQVIDKGVANGLQWALLLF